MELLSIKNRIEDLERENKKLKQDLELAKRQTLADLCQTLADKKVESLHHMIDIIREEIGLETLKEKVI